MTKRLTDPADILEKAADILETEGWCQESFSESNPKRRFAFSYCAVGALRVAAGYSAEYVTVAEEAEGMEELINGVIDHLELGVNFPGTSYQDKLMTFNDEPDTTADMVIDLFKHKAKDLRNRKEAA